MQCRSISQLMSVHRRRLGLALAALAMLGVLTLGWAPAAHAQSDAVLSDRLGVLAQDIVKRSTSNNIKSLAILYFSVGDEPCTALSSYLVDGLTVSYYSLPQQPLQLVDRQNIEAIIAEAGLGDILDPQYGRQVNTIAGVEAFVVGSLVLSADAVQVTAKLLSIDARVLGASVVSLPRTATIDQLLNQPVSSGVFCSQKASSGGGMTGQASGSSPGSNEPFADPGRTLVSGELSVKVEGITTGSDGKSVLVRVLVSNSGDTSIRVAICKDNLTIVDDNGNDDDLQVSSGIYEWGDWCPPGDIRKAFEGATKLEPGVVYAASLKCAYCRARGEVYDVSGTLLKFRSKSEVEAVPMNFPGVPETTKQ